jgi:hypothetical protein
MSVPGIGVIGSSIVVTAIGSGGTFEHGRDFAVRLGLVHTGARTREVGADP